MSGTCLERAKPEGHRLNSTEACSKAHGGQVALIAGNGLVRTSYESVRNLDNLGDSCQRGGHHIVGPPLSEQENLRIISDCTIREAGKAARLTRFRQPDLKFRNNPHGFGGLDNWRWPARGSHIAGRILNRVQVSTPIPGPVLRPDRPSATLPTPLLI